MKATYSVIRNTRLVRRCAAIACMLVLLITSVQTASAELIFKLQDTVVISNGVSPTTGTLHGVLQLTGTHLTTPPNNIMSVNYAFQTGARRFHRPRLADLVSDSPRTEQRRPDYRRQPVHRCVRFAERHHPLR